MSKRVIIFTMAVILLCVTRVFAVEYSFENLYPVADKFVTTEKTSPFGWDEKPWIYIELPEVGYKHDVTKLFWGDPAGDGDSLFRKANLILRDDNNRQIWVSFTDERWSNIKELGEWDVYAFSKLSFPGSGSPVSIIEKTSVMVTPEPVSSMLFIIGSLVLAVRRKFCFSPPIESRHS
ncbi:MAG: hypothetical protein KJ893_07065 [Candidatus Omnitrophica bacterium]|nr:hypothetical protein [Candidatus Omnitrophota bacterium]MBU4477889.1 hypothetical protein [Candidatus Omnitrophota bacterium]MCG2704215.1 hypothetical protein [Candidatus Omnitrophota bacterium]